MSHTSMLTEQDARAQALVDIRIGFLTEDPRGVKTFTVDHIEELWQLVDNFLTSKRHRDASVTFKRADIYNNMVKEEFCGRLVGILLKFAHLTHTVP